MQSTKGDEFEQFLHICYRNRISLKQCISEVEDKNVLGHLMLQQAVDFSSGLFHCSNSPALDPWTACWWCGSGDELSKSAVV